MKKMLGYGFAIAVGIGAIAFEMLESLNFWNIAFPPEKWYLAYLGFFLTSIAMLGYFYEFLYTAVGKTQKFVSLVMTLVCAFGALVTAGAGFTITSYASQGFSFTESDLAYMALIIQFLIAFHLLALFVYYGGEKIAEAWGDEDGDGTPNFMDSDYRGNKQQQGQKPVNVNALETRIAELKRENEKLRANSVDAPSESVDAPKHPPSTPYR